MSVAMDSATGAIDSAAGIGQLSPVRRAHHLAVSVVLSVLVMGGAACHRDKCVPFCEKTAKALHCSDPEHCKVQCKTLHESPVCLAELEVFEACMLQQPVDKWACEDSEGTPALKDGVCMPERTRVSNCLSTAPRPPQPKTP